MYELYSYSHYEAFHLFVQSYEDDEECTATFEGVAQLNGEDVFSSESTISGDDAEQKLIDQINDML